MATTTESTYIPTAEDVAFYREHGYFFTPKILSDELIERVIKAQDQFYEGIHEKWPFKKTPFIGWKKGQESYLRKNDYASLIVPELRELILTPIIGKVAKALCGEGVRLWQDQLSLKEPQDRESKTVMGWHNDRQYWACCSSEEMLTAWIPLEDMAEESGPITFLDGSHRWSKIEGMDFFSTDLKKLEKNITEKGLPINKVPAVIKKGQVSFHHCKTMHGSGANTSSRPRRAVAIHLQPISNSIVPNQFHIVKVLLSEYEDKTNSNQTLFPLLAR